MKKYKVIINGKDINNKQMRKEVEVYILHENDICKAAYEIGFYYISSYRFDGITTKIY